MINNNSLNIKIKNQFIKKLLKYCKIINLTDKIYLILKRKSSILSNIKLLLKLWIYIIWVSLFLDFLKITLIKYSLTNIICIKLQE